MENYGLLGLHVCYINRIEKSGHDALRIQSTPVRARLAMT